MNRTLRTILAIVFIAITTFSVISIFSNVRNQPKIDVTEQRLYTLSQGSKNIIKKIRQPLTLKLYYTKTAARKGPDQIQFFNNYYEYVKSLLEEYRKVSNGKINLQVIDPRPYSQQEENAIRYGLKKIPMDEEENFFFGLVLQTQFGATKTIPFFKPERQEFVEYDISHLIDSAIRRQKKRIGVISPLNVTGEDVSPYMARMMQMQGQTPEGPWTIIKQLKENYEVKKLGTDVRDINNVDILLVIHPKDLPKKTQFAIDQFVLNGGRTVVCADPYCIADQPKQQRQMYTGGHKQSSQLNTLTEKWGVTLPADTFAGDRTMAIKASLRQQSRPQQLLFYMGVDKTGLNTNNPITANLNEVRLLYPGVLEKTSVTEPNDIELNRIPLVSTTDRGNTWSVSNRYELMSPDPEKLYSDFTPGSKPVHMGYFITGKFESAFPEGIEIESPNDPNITEHLTGKTKAEQECAVAVFSDVDFITDSIAYQSSFFGKTPVADNANLLLNTIDSLAGSTNLISIRSKGSFQRPFTYVEKIRQKSEQQTMEEKKRIQAEIKGFEQELNNIASSGQGDQEIVGSEIMEKKKQLELKIHQARKRLRELKKQEREKIESLADSMRNLNTLPGPVLVLVIAVFLGIRRAVKRRRSISHASDA